MGRGLVKMHILNNTRATLLIALTALSKVAPAPAQAPLLLFCDDIPDGFDSLH